MLPERMLQLTLGRWGWEQRGWTFSKSWRFGHLPAEMHLPERKFDDKRWDVRLCANPIVQHRRGKRRFNFVLKPLGLTVEHNMAGGSYSVTHRDYTNGYTRATITVLSQSIQIKRQWVEWLESREQYLYNRDLYYRKWDAMKQATLAVGCPHLRSTHKPERPKYQERTVSVIDGQNVIGVTPDPAKAGELRCSWHTKEGDCRTSENGYSPTTYYFPEELMAFLDTPYKHEEAR